MLAQVKFLVIPLETYSGKPIRTIQALYANTGSVSSKDFRGMYENFTPDDFQRAALEKLSQANAKREGQALSLWIDDLVSRFYGIEKVCAANNEDVDMCGTKISVCTNTDWSSFAHDPKSAIGTVNETTGTFDIW